MAEQRVGHGDLGIRGPLRLFEQLVDVAAYEKRVLLDALPSVTAVDWSEDEGNAWATPFDRRFDDVLLDVISVEANNFPPLVRVESLTELRSTPGTFFYDIVEAADIPPLWDDGVTLWDDGITPWDQFSILYVNLPDGSNANNTTVVAKVGFHFSNLGTVEASFGDEKLENGGFESGLSGWSEVGSGLAFIQLTVGDSVIEGTQSVSWFLAAGSSNFKDLEKGFVAEEGQFYRLSVDYLATLDATMQIIIEGPGGDFIQANGREPGPTEDASIIVADTNGLLRRLVFDFRAWDSGNFKLRLRGEAPDNPTPVASWDDGATLWDDGVTLWDGFGATVPLVVADSISLKPIWRFQYYEPRLAARGLPSVQTGSRDIFFAAQEIGSGNISLVGSDGFFDDSLELFDWEQSEMLVRVGGAQRGTEREELLADDYRTQFKGIVRSDKWGDNGADFSLEDVRGFINRSVPFRVYDLLEFADMDPAIEGKSRPVWFGPQSNITPSRIALTVDEYGLYELADPDPLVNGITSVDSVFAYADDTAAGIGDAARRVLLVEGTDYSVDLTLARITILEDVQLFEVTEENNFIDWNQGGGAVQAQVAVGVYTAAQYAVVITTALNSASGAGKSCSYDQSTNKFTIDLLAGTLNLLTQTGVNKSAAIWGSIGFNTDADKTGSLAYIGDEAVFVLGDADTKHVLRVDGVGVRDAVPLPKYTTISGDPLVLGPDIARFIWERFLQQSLDLVDEDSFSNARTAAPQTLGIYLSTPTDIRAVFLKLQNSNRANIVIDGDGRIRYIVNQPGVIPAGTPVLEDSDYINIQVDKQIGDVHGVIRILFARDPSTGASLVRTAIDPETAVKFKRTSAKEFDTFLLSISDAVSISLSFLSIAAEPPRKAMLTLKGLVDKVEGEKLILNRARGLDDSGGLTDELFRILLVRKQPDSAQTEILAVEDV